MSLAGLSSRPMRVKIIYTFDKSHSMTCLARTDSCLDIPVATMDDDPVCVGVVELAKCLQTICRSSPEITTSPSNDFVVYSRDMSENHNGGLYVGHGFLSALLASSVTSASTSADSHNNTESSNKPAMALQGSQDSQGTRPQNSQVVNASSLSSSIGGTDTRNDMKRDSNPVYVVGKVCNSLLPIFDSSETLEVQLRLTPIALSAPQVPAPTPVQSVPAPSVSYTSKPQSQHDNTTLAAPVAPSPACRSMTIAELEASVRMAKRQKSAPTSYYSHYLASSPPNQSDSSSTPVRALHASSFKTHLPLAPRPIDNSRKSLQQGNEHDNENENTSAGLTSDMSSSPSPSDNKSTTASVSGASSIGNETLGAPNKGTTSITIANSTATNSTATNSTANTKSTANNKNQKQPKKPRDKFKVAKQLVAALTEGKIPTYCENCGSIQTPTWRRVKTDDGEVLLCNPCGLWYATKKTMRPEEVWGRRKRRQVGTPDINTYLDNVLQNNGNHGKQGTNDSSGPSGPAGRSNRRTEIKRSASLEPMSAPATVSRPPEDDLPTPMDGSSTDEGAKSSSARSSPGSSSQAKNENSSNNSNINDNVTNTGSLGTDMLIAHTRPSLLHSSSNNHYSSPLHPSNDFLEKLGSRSSPPPPAHPHGHSSSALMGMHMPMSESSRLELPGHTLISHNPIEQELDSNKENVPPKALPMVEHDHQHEHDDHFDIDILFMTPKKRSLSASAEITPTAHRTITPASKWISRIIQKTEDEDIFKAFMESPSSHRFTDQLSAAMTSFDDELITSESTNTVPSSPPPSFFYQYDEDPLPRKAKEQAQLQAQAAANAHGNTNANAHSNSNMHTTSNTPAP